jgi:hypothetical protein
MDYKNRIKNISLEFFGSIPIAIKDNSKGVDHKVYIVKLADKKVVFRFPLRQNSKLFTHSWTYEKLLDVKVPVPRILKLEQDYLIETYIEGVPAHHLDDKYKAQVMYALGKYAKKDTFYKDGRLRLYKKTRFR